MHGVKGCFVCGQDHRANTRQSRDEVTAAVKKLKEKHPSSLLTVEDLEAVLHMVDQEGQAGDDEDFARWACESEDDDSYFALITIEDAVGLERSFANISFLHGRSHETDMYSVLATMDYQLQNGEGPYSTESVWTRQQIDGRQ